MPRLVGLARASVDGRNAGRTTDCRAASDGDNVQARASRQQSTASRARAGRVAAPRVSRLATDADRASERSSSMRLVLHWLITAAALVVAAWLLPGIHVESQNGWVVVLVMAAVLGLVNALVRPVLTF